MAKSVAAIVRRGGVLVYAVCSLAPQEGPQVIESFLASNREFAVDRGAIVADGFPIPLDDQGYLRTRPNRGGVDGFFAARMKRR
jgi:16S rRNA (cytosine967-C5)-methyltransferase